VVATKKLTGRALGRCALTLALMALTAGAQTLDVAGACRNGVPNGAYELRMQDGRLRVVGAFAHGRKTGTFIFWNASGARVAVIPYDDDEKTGTVALWYTVPGARRESQRKLEAPYVENKLHGIKRSWNPRGTRLAEFRYQRGVLVEARAWDDDGAARPRSEAEAQAATDEVTDQRFFAELEALIRDHLPHCD
jgi:hypothetical protein